MLKRALLAAEDEGLPHKAICDYLHTLSQMAKLERTDELNAPYDPSRETVEEVDVHPRNAPELPQDPAMPNEVRARLRQAIADIYGISLSPEVDFKAAHPDKAEELI